MSLGSTQIVSPGQSVTFDCYDACADEVLYDQNRRPLANDSGLGMSGNVSFVMSVELAPGEVFDPNTDMRGAFVDAYMRTGMNDNVRFEFDLMNGTGGTLPATKFTPTVHYPRVEGRVQPKLKVGFSIGKGTLKSAVSHLRRTYDVEIEPDTSSVAQVIPKFADRASFDSADPLISTARLQQLVGFDGAVIDSALMGRTEALAVPYAPGAMSFSVVNPDEQNPLVLRVSWRLIF